MLLNLGGRIDTDCFFDNSAERSWKNHFTKLSSLGIRTAEVAIDLSLHTDLSLAGPSPPHPVLRIWRNCQYHLNHPVYRNCHHSHSLRIPHYHVLQYRHLGRRGGEKWEGTGALAINDPV